MLNLVDILIDWFILLIVICMMPALFSVLCDFCDLLCTIGKINHCIYNQWLKPIEPKEQMNQMNFYLIQSGRILYMTKIMCTPKQPHPNFFIFPLLFLLIYVAIKELYFCVLLCIQQKFNWSVFFSLITSASETSRSSRTRNVWPRYDDGPQISISRTETSHG